MQKRALRVLEIYGAPEDFGRLHGEVCAQLITSYLEDRLELASDPKWSGRALDREQILALAAKTIPHHQEYAPDLYQEMESMAAAVGISPAEALTVGGFTDIIDVVRGVDPHSLVEDDCTAVIDPDQAVLAQTWDMHASASDYVMVLKLDPVEGPGSIVQTTAGCLGQIGINEAGVAVGINNLSSVGKPGVTWNFVVRKVLQQTSLDAAVTAVLEADLAGGHNFLLLGPDGEGANIEAMPRSHRVSRVTDEAYVHSNHCFDVTTKLEESGRTQENIDDSLRRVDLGQGYAGDLDAFFSDPRISKPVTDPHLVATCGAVKMFTRELRMEAVWGVPGESNWETFQL